MIVIFLMLSTVCTYFIFGDRLTVYYKDFRFIFIKNIQSFFRGTLDNSDFDDMINRNKVEEILPKLNLPYEGRMAEYPLYSISSKTGSFTYVFVRLLSY